jgi:hypothetical protein
VALGQRRVKVLVTLKSNPVFDKQIILSMMSCIHHSCLPKRQTFKGVPWTVAGP